MRSDAGDGGANGSGLGPGSGHVGDLAAGYALGALEPVEREQVERHRRLCPACGRLLAEAERVVASLPFAVPAVAPPPDVKLGLFARVAHNRRGPSPTLTIPASRPQPSPAVPEPVPGAGAGSRRRIGWATALVAAPLLAVLVVLGTWTVHLRAEAEERGARAESFGAILEQALAGDGTVYELMPGPAAPEARGWVVTDAGQRSATFYMKAGKERSGQRYRLLTYRDGEPAVLGTVRLDGRGRGAVPLALARPLPAYRQLSVRKLLPGEARAGGLALWGSTTEPAGTPVAAQPSHSPQR